MPNPIQPAKPLPTPPPSSGQSKYGLKVGVGGGFKKAELNKSLGKIVRGPSFSNVSPTDRKFISDLIQKRAQNLPTASSFSHSTRQGMKSEIEQAKQSGKISSVDSQKFKKMVDGL